MGATHVIHNLNRFGCLICWRSGPPNLLIPLTTNGSLVAKPQKTSSGIRPVMERRLSLGRQPKKLKFVGCGLTQFHLLERKHIRLYLDLDLYLCLYLYLYLHIYARMIYHGLALRVFHPGEDLCRSHEGPSLCELGALRMSGLSFVSRLLPHAASSPHVGELPEGWLLGGGVVTE